jgi:hypothetical protein
MVIVVLIARLVVLHMFSEWADLTTSVNAHLVPYPTQFGQGLGHSITLRSGVADLATILQKIHCSTDMVTSTSV